MPHHILLLGSDGLLGQHLQQLPLPPGWLLHPMTHKALDIADHFNVRDLITRLRPDVIINAAGLSSLEKCEADERLAMRTNFQAVAILARLCADHDIPLIHLSTPLVFDGRKTTPYHVDDLMNPLNMYGKSNLMGEEALRQTMPFSVILRLSSLFSLENKNILTTLLRKIKRHEALYAAQDRLIMPTCAMDAARAILKITEQIIAGKNDAYGTFHLGSSPVTSPYSFVEKLLTQLGAYEDEETTQELHTKPHTRYLAEGGVPLPINATMDCQKIKDVYGIEAESWDNRLAAYVALYAQKQEKQEG